MIDEPANNDVEIARNTSAQLCSICLCDVVDDKYTTPCQHIFHKKCIEGSYIRFHFCPYCRTEITVSTELEQTVAPEPQQNAADVYNRITKNIFLISVAMIGFCAIMMILIYSI